MAKDVLKELLDNPDDVWIPRALTDRSCMNSHVHHVSGINETNFELATLGDSILRMCLIDVFLDKGDELSHLKEKYERDEILVTVIGKAYNILDYLRHSELDDHWPTDYVWEPHGNNNRDHIHKHIATAMEALLGAVYRIRGISSAKSVVNTWIGLVDQNEKQ